MSRADIILLASVALLLFLLPAMSSEFFISQIATRVLILGIIALSLSFLAQEIGIISLAQVMIAGIAGYAIALMSHNSAGLGVEMPLVVAVVGAILAAGLAGILMGIVAQRSTGIYAIMITLATSVAFTLFRAPKLSNIQWLRWPGWHHSTDVRLDTIERNLSLLLPLRNWQSGGLDVHPIFAQNTFGASFSGFA